MSKFPTHIFRTISILLLSFIANSYYFLKILNNSTLVVLLIFIFISLNFIPSLSKRNYPSFRIRMCYHGSECLKFFLASTLISIIFHIILAIFIIPNQWSLIFASTLVCTCAETIIFWNGIISVYCSSLQLGIKYRVIGILCGLIPIVHLVVLGFILRIVSDEISFETTKFEINKKRHNEAVCQTKYPVLLVHGVFFRDYKFTNYWGRIPKELINNGAVIYYGNNSSASSIEKSGLELSLRIKEIVETTNCGRINIIAHSKGGIDCRYALSHTDTSKYVASLTTINTPHRGCGFADYLLNKIPVNIQKGIASKYNYTLQKLGDRESDFISALNDLTEKNCAKINEEVQNVPGVFYQSVGSKLNHAASGKFPLNYSYHLVKYFDGSNDGLVSEKSFEWGDNYIFLTAPGRRGISHGDMIDLNKENIPGFDVREFYVQLLADLKNKGL